MAVEVTFEGSRLPATPQEKIETLIGFMQGLEIEPAEAVMLALTVAVRIADTHADKRDCEKRMQALTEMLNLHARWTCDAIWGEPREGRLQ